MLSIEEISSPPQIQHTFPIQHNYDNTLNKIEESQSSLVILL